MRLRRFLTAALAAALLAPASAGASLVVGIGDQKADMFGDPLFEQLGVKHARIAVSWDALNRDWQRARLDQWMDGAQRLGIEPLVGFSHSPGKSRRVLPTPERFKFEFRRFRERYPFVTNFAAWNEANHCGEPTCHRPKLVAAYYRALKQECKECKILATELLDMPNMGKWVKDFIRYTGYQPRYWGLHNYVDANRFRTSGTRRLLHLTTGEIWFTETGGIVKRKNRRKVTFNESAQHAADATRWVFDRLAKLSRRITRVYVYHWNAERTIGTWDSALVAYNGTPRPAFRVLRSRLSAIAAAAERENAMLAPPSPAAEPVPPAE